MKRRLLSALLALMCILGMPSAANALNPYAYGLKADVSPDASKITVHYTLNDNAGGECKVQIVLKGADNAYTFDGTTLVGENVVEIPTADLPKDVELSWEVFVSAMPVATPTEHDKYVKFYCPHGVIVDANPASPHFGRAIVAEGITPGSKSGYISSDGEGCGLYAFDPQLNSICNSDGGYAFKGGLEYTAGTRFVDPMRVSLTNDGRIFMGRCSFGGTASPLYEVNPDDLNAPFTEFFKGAVDAETSELKDADGNFIAAQVVGMDFKGEGEDLEMVILSCNNTGAAFVYGGFRADTYKIGTAKEWATAPSSNIDVLTGQYTISPSNASLIYDNEGGYWYCQYRGAPSDAQPAIVHVNAEGVEDYKDITTVCGGGGIRFNRDFTKVVIANAKNQVGVYTVAKDENNKPVLTLLYQFTTTIGTNCNDMAWDYADNLWIVGNSSEFLKVFALPRENGDVTTPAVGTVKIVEPTPLPARNAMAYDIIVKKEGDLATVNYRLNAPTNEVKVQLIADGVVIREVAGTTYAFEEGNSNSAVIDTKGVYGHISFRVVAVSDCVETPTECSKAYRFYHPAGVAVDNNTDSPYFGRVYATEAMPVATDPYVSKNVGQGLYVFDQLMNPVLNANGEQGFKGGMGTAAKMPNGTTNSYDPRRVRISKDGRVFISRQNAGVSPLFEVNPDDLNADFIPVFKNWTYDEATWTLNDANGNFMGAANVGFDVKGEGDDLKVVMLSANANGFAYVNSGFSCDEYDLGTATEWTTVPSRNIDALTAQYSVNYMGINIAYDDEGGIWYCQYRGAPSEAEPALVHVNAEGTVDYMNTTIVARQGAFALSPDFKQIAMANAAKQIGVYNIEKGEEGALALTLAYQFATNIGNNCNDIAWDLAGNLYIVGNSGEWIKTFALPREYGEVAVDAPAEYSYTVLPTEMYLIGQTTEDYQWRPDDTTHPMEAVEEGVFEIKNVTVYGDHLSYIAFTATPGDSWFDVNNNRWGPKIFDSQLFVGDNEIYRVNEGSFAIAPGTYSFRFDLNTGFLTVTGEVAPVEYPEQLYAIGAHNGWNSNDDTYILTKVEGSEATYEGTIPVTSEGEFWFVFTSVVSTDWGVINANRYGPENNGDIVTLDNAAKCVKTPETAYCFNATEAFTMNVTVDLAQNTLLITKPTGTEAVNVEAAKAIGGYGEIRIVGDANAIEVYSINGALISKGETIIPCNKGIYVVVIDGKSTKVAVK